MPVLSYEYQKPTQTYTIDQFISCQSDSNVNYCNLSFIDRVGRMRYTAANVISDYIDELRDEYCVTVELTDDELNKYSKRPKLLCHRIYGNGELFPIILIINDMWSIKQFTKKKLLMPTKIVMADICKRMLNANRAAIQKYNSINDVDSE